MTDSDDDDNDATIVGTAGATMKKPLASRHVDSATELMIKPFAAAAPWARGARPAPARPAVPSAVEDTDSVTDLTLVELIDAEVESPSSVSLSLHPDLYDSSSSDDSEATVQLAVPDDIPRDILERGTPIGRLPSSPMTATPAVSPATPTSVPDGPAAAPGDTVRRAEAPTPTYVARYLLVCFVASLLGACVLALLKSQRYW